MEFAESVNEGLIAIDEASADVPQNEGEATPIALRNLSAWIRPARRVAETILLCPNAISAIEALRNDWIAVRCLMEMRKNVDPKDQRIAILQAYQKTTFPPAVPPMRAAASFIIELCDGLELDQPQPLP